MDSPRKDANLKEKDKKKKKKRKPKKILINLCETKYDVMKKVAKR